MTSTNTPEQNPAGKPSSEGEPQPQNQFKVTVENPNLIFDQLKRGLNEGVYSFFGEASLDNDPLEEIMVRSFSDGTKYEFSTLIHGSSPSTREDYDGKKGFRFGDYERFLPRLMDSPLKDSYRLKLMGKNIYILDDNNKQLFAISANEGMHGFSIESGGKFSTLENMITTPEDFNKWLTQYADVIQKTVDSIYAVDGKTSPDSELIIRPLRQEPSTIGKGENGGLGGVGNLGELFKSLDPKEMLKKEIVVEERPNISFEQIGGQEEAKEELEAISTALTKPQLYQKWGTRPPRGVMLFGPPGTGKTLMVKALASEAEATFIHASISGLTSMWHGEGEKQVKRVFEIAREARKAIIFIDEVDAFGKRETASEPTIRMLNTLLEQMDGMNTNDNFIIVCATNRPDALDDAFKRPGRIDKWVEVPLPDQKGLKQIFSIHLQAARNIAGRELFGNIDFEKLSYEAERLKFSGADVAEMVRRTLEKKAREEDKTGNEPGLVGMDDILISLSSYERIKKAKNDIGFQTS